MFFERTHGLFRRDPHPLHASAGIFLKELNSGRLYQKCHPESVLVNGARARRFLALHSLKPGYARLT